MITCGIEIDNNTAIILCLEKYDDGNIETCEHSTKIALNDHENADSIKEFADLIYSQLNTIGADKIGIIKRQTKGPYAAGALSFKIESIIQCYKGGRVELIALATIKAFLKRNPKSINSKYKYQENALNTAFYLIKK
jgi:Protein of unknown function (DUF3010)